jgi:hypothetical protein
MHAEGEVEMRLIDDTDGIHDCLANLYPKDGDSEVRSSSSSSIAMDTAWFYGKTEGKCTCRVSTLQLCAADSKTVWVLDITALGKKAFEEKDESGHSLRGMLEDKDVKKVALFYV